MLGHGLSLARRVAFGPIWTPARLFSKGQQGVWYEPRPEYLYQDSAGTVPVAADGDPVGYMQDLSGNGNHATQSTSAARPIYRTDGALHWLEFDGVDDVLTATGTASVFRFLHDGSDNYMQVAVGGYGVNGENVQLAGTGRVNTATTGGHLYKSSSDEYRALVANGAVVAALAGSIFSPPSSFLEEFSMNNGALRLFRNGSELDSTPLGDPSQGDSGYPFAIGATGLPDFFAAVTIFGIIVHEGGKGQSQSRSHLAKLAGVTL